MVLEGTGTLGFRYYEKVRVNFLYCLEERRALNITIFMEGI